MNDYLKPRTLFATIFYSTFCYLCIRQLPIPPALNTIVSGLFGYYFGTRSEKYKKKNGGD